MFVDGLLFHISYVVGVLLCVSPLLANVCVVFLFLFQVVLFGFVGLCYFEFMVRRCLIFVSCLLLLFSLLSVIIDESVSESK